MKGASESGALTHAQERKRDPRFNFPKVKDRVPLCAPSPAVDYYRAKKLLLTGLAMGEVCEKIGNGCTRASLMEAAHVLDDVVEFNNTEQFSKLAVSDRITREALAGGVAQDRVKRKRKETPDGIEEVEESERSIDVAALRLASEHIAPEIHGKLASGKATTAVQVNISLADAVAEVERMLEASRSSGQADTTTGCGLGVK